jgi:hypothetical protein
MSRVCVVGMSDQYLTCRVDLGRHVGWEVSESGQVSLLVLPDANGVYTLSRYPAGMADTDARTVM